MSLHTVYLYTELRWKEWKLRLVEVKKIWKISISFLEEKIINVTVPSIPISPIRDNFDNIDSRAALAIHSCDPWKEDQEGKVWAQEGSLAGGWPFVRKSQSVESPGRISHNQTGIANLSDQAYDWPRSNHDHLSYTMGERVNREKCPELFVVNHNGLARVSQRDYPIKHGQKQKEHIWRDGWWTGFTRPVIIDPPGMRTVIHPCLESVTIFRFRGGETMICCFSFERWLDIRRKYEEFFRNKKKSMDAIVQSSSNNCELLEMSSILRVLME